MLETNNFRTGRHCVFAMHAHLVFVTKYRLDIFTAPVLSALRPVFAKVCSDFEVQLVSFEGERDHVHLLVNYPPQVSVSKLVNSLKGVSSRRLRQDCPEVAKHYWKKKVLWSPSCFASSCGGAPLELIKQYIAQQERPK